MSEDDNYKEVGDESEEDSFSPGRDEFSPTADSWFYIKIYVQANQPELLQGLESWLGLGLISQDQIKKIARHRLSCDLPTPVIVESTPVLVETPDLTPVLVAATVPNAFQRVCQSFLDELSIRWLLFLGIFLVVVSSGVLAASQWQNFPDFGQYLVLLLYTLGFWGISWWTKKQNSLKLTSQTLKAIATLLIPINFWAMSHLGLGSNPPEWGIIGIAAITLTAISYFASAKNKLAGWRLILFGLLSYAHLGWQVNYFPLLAVYGGMGLICGMHYLWLLPRRRYPVVDLLFVLAAWLLLPARIFITPTYYLADYSLAIAIFAWLVASIYLHQASKTRVVALKHQSAAIINAFLGKVGKIFCIMLFIFTWSISLNGGILQSFLYFWQTVAISGLAIHLFSQRLNLYWQKRDLTAIFLIGLQTLYVCKELIPDSLRHQALDLSIAVSKTEYFPESVFGVTLFPYIILFILIASWLYRQGKTQLALYSEYLTLILGIVLTCLSLSNPTWRSLNLLLSTITFGYVAQIRQPRRSSLVYLTHLLGLVTLVNGIAVIFPDLDRSWWSVIAVALMTGEWGIYLIGIRFSRNQLKTLINQSCWYFGLVLSALSYSCFLAEINTASTYWGLIWLITPAMLTLIAKYTPQITQRRLATVTSCVALLLAQILVFGQWETRVLGLVAATGLMFINAFNFRRTIVTITHLGLAIALIASLVAPLMGENSQDAAYWLPVGGIVIILLYQLRLSLLKTSETPKFDYISQRTAFGILGVGREAKNFKLIGKYIQAADYWAMVLIALELIIVSAIYFLLGSEKINQSIWLYLLATILLIGAILWRYRSQPNNLVLYTLTWLASVFTVGLLKLGGNSNLGFATGNIILGLIALVVVTLLAQANSPWRELNLSYVPVAYAVLGILWRLSNFNAYTGLLTLGAAFILLNTQHNSHQINSIVKYLGFASISWGIYELVIYQMQSASGGSAADGLTILSLVAAVIAFSYRLTAWWYGQKQWTTLFNLKLSQVILIAHFHWGISSLLKIIAAGIVIETNTPRLTMVSIATSFCLGAYALIQGRDRQINTATRQDRDWWVYIGLVEIAATLVYSRLIINRLSLFDPWRVVFTCGVALLIYQIPWQNFGWRATPWRRTSLIIPVLMALVTAEDISYFSLLITALFYLRIAYAQQNIRWSYISLGLINWLAIRLAVEYRPDTILVTGIISLSLLYIAQVDPYLRHHRSQRHYLRLGGSSLFCLVALLENPGITPGAIAFCLIFLGLGLRIRAFLFTGTITLILTVLHQLIILVFTYSFLKWVVGLLAGIGSIAIAAGFENQRDRLAHQVQTYNNKLKNWQ